MKNFAEYTVNDFAAEPLFIKWVQQPHDTELDNFWKVWIDRNPHKRPEIDDATLLVKSITATYDDPLEEGEVNFLWHNIIYTLEDSLTTNSVVSYSLFDFVKWTVAVLFFLSFCGWLVWKFF